MAVERFSLNREPRDDRFVRQELDRTTAGSTDPIRLAGMVGVQLAGTATNVVAIVERCTRDPAADANWSPAEDDAFAGNLSLGMAARNYDEPTVAWWRVRFTTLSGGTAKVSITGEDA